jgi:hypothetical protein
MILSMECALSEHENIFRCCLCHKDGTLGLRTATLMRLDCVKHGPVLHQRWVRLADRSLEPAEARTPHPAANRPGVPGLVIATDECSSAIGFATTLSCKESARARWKEGSQFPVAHRFGLYSWGTTSPSAISLPLTLTRRFCPWRIIANMRVLHARWRS